MDWVLACLIVFIILFVLGYIFYLIYEWWDKVNGNEVWFHAKIEDKDYDSARGGVTVSPIIGGRGGVAIGSNYEDEKCNLILSVDRRGELDEDQESVVFHCDRKFYIKVKVGQNVELKYIKGRSGTYYGPEAIRSELPPKETKK